MKMCKTGSEWEKYSAASWETTNCIPKFTPELKELSSLVKPQFSSNSTQNITQPMCSLAYTFPQVSQPIQP
jgi:hypothetical protein